MFMTNITNGNYGKLVFFGIPLVVVILGCWFFADKTFLGIYFWKFVFVNSIFYSTMSQTFFGILLMPFFARKSCFRSSSFALDVFFLGNFILFCPAVIKPILLTLFALDVFMVSFGCRKLPLCGLAIHRISEAMTYFTLIMYTEFSRFAFAKFGNWFDLLASRASFCYNLRSHIRSFLTGLVKAAVGVRPVCGLSIISDGSF